MVSHWPAQRRRRRWAAIDFGPAAEPRRNSLDNDDRQRGFDVTDTAVGGQAHFSAFAPWPAESTNWAEE